MRSIVSLLPSVPTFLSPRVLSILIMETAERFTYYGFRAVLVLYFRNYLHFPESTSISLFAYTTSLAYLSPILGAIVSDSYLGRYRTILHFGWVYQIGLILLTIGAFLPSTDSNIDVDGKQVDNSSLERSRLTVPLTFIGLFLICLGTGGIKPCVSAFGADQVIASNNMDTKADHHNAVNNDNPKAKNEADIQEFYAWFYFCINFGSVGSFIFVPTVRAKFGFGAAFLLSTTFLYIAMLCFKSKGDEYVKHEEHQESFLNAKKKEKANCDQGEDFIDSSHEFEVSDENSKAFLASTFHIIFLYFSHHLMLWWKNKSFLKLKRRRYRHKDDSIETSDTGFEGKYEGIDLDIYDRNNVSARKFDVSFVDNNNSQKKNNRLHQKLPKNQYLISEPPSQLGTEVKQNIAADNMVKDANTEDFLRKNFSQDQIENAMAVIKILPVLSTLPAFWMLYDQHSSVWTLQASRMNLHGLQPEQLGAVNPILIMILIPLFDRMIYPTVKQWGWDISYLRRMSVGMFIASLSFVVSGFLEWHIESNVAGNNGISVIWQLPQILILSTAEILVSVTGLEFSYSQSPSSMKAMVMALYLLTSAVGNFFGGLLYTIWGDLNRDIIMYICAGILGLNLFIFLRIANNWESSLNNREDEYKVYSSITRNENSYQNIDSEII